MKKIALLLIISFSVGLFGCGFSYNRIEGNGNKITKSVSLQTFKKIDASNAFEINVTIGEEPSVKIITDENIIKFVEANVKNDILHLKMKDNYNYNGKILIEISTKSLVGFDLSGACKIDIKNISTDKFSIDVSGACKGSLSGEVNELILNLSGATKLDASELKARNISADMSGASKLSIYCTEVLDIEGSGASKVTVFGNPKIQKTDFSGASSIYYK